MTSTEETPEERQFAPDSLGDLLDGVLTDIEAVGVPELPPGRLQGVRTGFLDLDSLTVGLAAGSLSVIASRPSIGRTTMLSHICRTSAITDGRPTAVFTLEEDHTRFITRILSAEARVSRHRIHTGGMTGDDWSRLAETMPRINNAPLFIKTPPAITMAELAEQAAKLVEEHGVELIAVDGIQDIKPARISDLREREVGDAARGLKTLARELGVPVVATSHLNRGPEQRYDKKPRLDDLRESGAVTFAADLIILIHRPDAYDLESPRAGEADLIVAKHRNYPTATITVAFQSHYGRFVNLALD